jgi:hypothetical protein
MPHLSERTPADYGTDLRRAEEHVTEGRRIVQMQKGRIVRLKAAGVDTSNAECTLRLFESNLRRFEEHRDILTRNSAVLS